MGLIVERKVRQYYGAAVDMASIPAAGKSVGDLYFATDTKVCYRWDGAAWVFAAAALSITAAMLAADSVETLKVKDANITSPKLDALNKGIFENALLHIQDQKASGTESGTFTQDAWRTRDLNTVLTNEIAGASLAANQITLPAGTYFIEGCGSAYKVSAHKVKIFNVTDASDVLIGSSEYTYSVDAVTGWSKVSGRFTIAAQKVLELQHYCQTTRATDGYGVKTAFGVIEVFSDVKVWKKA